MIPNITTGSDFGGLIHYLVENRDHEVIDLQGVSSVALAADEMAAIAALSSRAKVKLIHLSFSAAHEDGTLSADRWLTLANRMERAFGLKGHQRVMVRHRDKSHDHVHTFWNTIAAETGCTPPKRWFLRKGFAIDDVGPHALTNEQVARVPIEQRALHTYDFILLRRAQHLCRRLEREFGLRELRSPQQAVEARAAGEMRPAAIGQAKRAERTGSAALIQNAGAIRAALDQADWPSKRLALLTIGLDLQPVYRMTSKGEELRGVVIVDRADPGNRMKASQLDTNDLKYGWRKLDERRAPGALSLESWWPQRESVPFVSPDKAKTPADQHRAQFLRSVERHRLDEVDRKAKRLELRKRQKREIGRLRVGLMRRRATQAAQLKPEMRRQFYAGFQANVREPELNKLAELHLLQGLQFVRMRKPVWTGLPDKDAHTIVRNTRAVETRITDAQRPSSGDLAKVLIPPAQQLTTTRTEPAHAVETSVVRKDEVPASRLEAREDGISAALAAALLKHTRAGGR